MKVRSQINLQQLHQINLNQNMCELDDSKAKNKIINLIKFNIDVAFVILLLLVAFQRLIMESDDA